MNGVTPRTLLGRSAVAALILVGLIGCEYAVGRLIVAPGSSIAAFDETVRISVQVADGLVHTTGSAVTQLGNAFVLIPFAVFVGWLSRDERTWRPAMFGVVAVAGAELITQTVKRLVQRERPVGSDAYGWAFPSGHVTVAAAVSVATAALLASRVQSPVARTALWFAAALVVVAVGWSRIALGAHWFSDVVTAAVVTTVWVGVSYWVVDPVRPIPEEAANAR